MATLSTCVRSLDPSQAGSSHFQASSYRRAGGQVTISDGVSTPQQETIDLAQEPLRIDRHATASSTVHLRRLPTTPPPLKPAQLREASPHKRSSPPRVTILQTDFELQTRANEDETSFTAPALWQAANADDQPRASLSPLMWSERSAAAFLGFAAGMLIIVPAVFYLSIENSPTPTGTAVPDNSLAAPTKLERPEEVPKFQTASMANGRWINAATTPTTERSDEAVDAQPALVKLQAMERETIKTAKGLVAEGRLSDARAMLRQAASPDTAKLWLLLAETYDPNFGNKSAAVEDIVDQANRKFARFYYSQALTHGVTEARARLAALAGMP